jgi:exopolysaccharide biosynthesis polyprenyl glycosylphosphotransferase
VSASAGVEQLFEALDDRTLKILERRRGTGAIRRRGWLVSRALLAADIVGISVAFLGAQEIYAAHTSNLGSFSRLTEFVTFALSLPVWVVAAKLYGLYDRDEEHTDHSTADDFAGVFHLVTVCTFGLYAVSHLTQWFHPEFSKLLVFWVLAVFCTVCLRAAARAYCRRQIEYLQNTIIVGAGHVGQTIAQKLLKHPEYGLNLVGFIDSHPKERLQDLRHLTVLGDLADLAHVVRLLDVERVIIAFTNDSHEELLQVTGDLRPLDVQIDIVPRLFDKLGPSIAIHSIEGLPLVGLPPNRLPRSSTLVKRSLDVIVATLGLLVLSPLLLVVAVGVKLSSDGPVLYRHWRVGQGGKPFQLIKFRTMHLASCRGADYGGESAEIEFARLMADPVRSAEFQAMFKLQDDPRVTWLGRFLRRTSIDELPQLLNVLRGDISLVGPRALTEEELERYYGDSARDLLAIRPGVTGYWQINGRSDLAYEDRVRLDMAYIGGWSLGLDFLIMARTLRVILGRGGAI